MIRVCQHTQGFYLVDMDTPEKVIVDKIATAYSIPKTDAIAAIINRGMDSIGQQVKQADNGKTLKQLREEQEQEG